MMIINLVLVFFLGASFASFLNVLAGGSGDIRKNLERKRSVCESCKEPLRWWELVPVLSWVALSGRCARCGGRIPVFHPLSEIVLGTMFVVTYSVILPGGVLPVAGALLFVIVLYFFGVYDLFHGTVRNKYLYPVLVLVFLGRVVLTFFHGDISALLSPIVGAMWFFLFFAVLNMLCRWGLFPGVSRGTQGFGWGDAKYGVFLGLVLGWPSSFAGLWSAIFLGGFFSIILLIFSKKKMEKIPFVPFLSVGAWVAMLWGNAIMELARNMIL
jgi:prepilin signal peptidase PulO-like enzyme (type II secretory pathway)